MFLENTWYKDKMVIGCKLNDVFEDMYPLLLPFSGFSFLSGISSLVMIKKKILSNLCGVFLPLLVYAHTFSLYSMLLRTQIIRSRQTKL